MFLLRLQYDINLINEIIVLNIVVEYQPLARFKYNLFFNQ